MKFLKRHLWAVFGGGLFVASVIAVFFYVLPKYAGLIAPDSMPFFPQPWRTLKVKELLTSGTFTPHNLYWLIFNPLYAHELTYIVDSLVLALGGVYYLRSQRVHPLAAWFGGLALGLSGYTFTLFSAGHRGYFHMFSCAVWAFGFIARGFETRRLVFFALLGLVLAWGVPYQPDVLLLVGALTAAYALWRTIKDAGAKGTGSGAERGRKAGILPVILHVWPRFAVSLIVLALAGFSGIRSAVTTQITNRDAQIAGASGKTEKADGGKEGQTPEEKRARWLFATNWSLPPEDVLEFFVPGIFGNDSAQPPYPYWGRLGRPDDSVFQKGRMMPNYRQHTVYLGLIPLLFALFALFAWRGRRNEDDADTASGCRLPASDLPFWCGAWGVCLLLAFGRYTPVYRLFYAVPYMDYIRAPVKFLHLVEIATAFLAGFGMDAFLRTGQTVLRRRLLWLAAGMAGLLLVGAGVAWAAKPSVVGHVAALGMGQVAEALSGYTVRNVMRAAVYAALAACAVFVAVRSAREGTRVAVACVLIGLAVLDQSLVARRYVRVIDLGPMYRENAVVKALKGMAPMRVANVVNYASQNTWQDGFSASLSMNGVRNLTLSAEERETPYGRIFMGLQKDPVRLWQTLQARAVIVPRKSAEGFFKSGVLQPVMDFELGAGVVRQVQQPGEKTFSLARVVRAEDTPRFTADWQGGVSADKQPEAVVNGSRTVSDAPVPERHVGAGKEAKIGRVSVSGLPGAFATRVRVSAEGPGLLVFDERLSEQQEVWVDGRPAPKYVADAIWPAVLVPMGEHEIVLRSKEHAGALVASMLVTLAVSCWAFIQVLFDRRMRRSAQASPS
jgi:hypothetical protein